MTHFDAHFNAPQGLHFGRLYSGLHAMPRLLVAWQLQWRDVTEQLPTAGHVLRAPNAAAACASAWSSSPAMPLSDFVGAHWLAPCDLQPVKAAGVTFAVSLLERLIEEHASGDASRAAELRQTLGAAMGGDLAKIVPGSPAAQALANQLKAQGLWSQYLEVGIGEDAEIFTKCPPMAAVGHMASVGIHRSTWNNPEPELVLAIDCGGAIVGAALGNDVNLRDVEGRSALLLGRAKDNNASTAIGPSIRLFDAGYGDSFAPADLLDADIALDLEGPASALHPGGFSARIVNSMRHISRSPQELARQLFDGHDYPDGVMLFCGTMAVPTADRLEAGKGFTHMVGDVVRVSSAKLGVLQNTVDLSTNAPPWRYGVVDLMRNLSKAGISL